MREGVGGRGEGLEGEVKVGGRGEGVGGRGEGVGGRSEGVGGRGEGVGGRDGVSEVEKRGERGRDKGKGAEGNNLLTFFLGDFLRDSVLPRKQNYMYMSNSLTQDIS